MLRSWEKIVVCPSEFSLFTNTCIRTIDLLSKTIILANTKVLPWEPSTLIGCCTLVARYTFYILSYRLQWRVKSVRPLGSDWLKPFRLTSLLYWLPSWSTKHLNKSLVTTWKSTSGVLDLLRKNLFDFR